MQNKPIIIGVTSASSDKISVSRFILSYFPAGKDFYD